MRIAVCWLFTKKNGTDIRVRIRRGRLHEIDRVDF